LVRHCQSRGRRWPRAWPFSPDLQAPAGCRNPDRTGLHRT
jgi:Sphingosine kinase and enzymes related to eukaryotic diacylglycerol kinase